MHRSLTDHSRRYRRLRNTCLAVTAAVLTFAAGAVLACNGNYCEEIDTWSCVFLDQTIQDSCCLNLDGTGTRCWTCTREVFDCLEGDGIVHGVVGPGYDCHSPGAACQ